MRKPNSPPAMQWIGETMEPMRAIYQACLIIAECRPLKTLSVRQRREVV